MPKEFKRRKVVPDIRYGSVLLARFINMVMKEGKKSVAEEIVYTALERLQEKTTKSAIEVFQDAVKNVRPIVEIKSRRIGGATYQIPVSVEERRSETLAFRWILDVARGKKGRPMVDKLTAELLDAYNKTGASMEKREATHRMAEANKAYAHFA
jgi:small subunit ribosomal protein S7